VLTRRLVLRTRKAKSLKQAAGWMASRLHPVSVEALIMLSTEILDCRNLAPGSLIDVETKSRHYQIECLGGDAIRISGHPEYCPKPVKAKLQGCVDPYGVLEFGVVGCGKRMRFMLDEYHPITTSTVVHIHLNRNN
jgi:hypothetical protein